MKGQVGKNWEGTLLLLIKRLLQYCSYAFLEIEYHWEME
jgi:hypothetical protein